MIEVMTGSGRTSDAGIGTSMMIGSLGLGIHGRTLGILRTGIILQMGFMNGKEKVSMEVSIVLGIMVTVRHIRGAVLVRSTRLSAAMMGVMFVRLIFITNRMLQTNASLSHGRQFNLKACNLNGSLPFILQTFQHSCRIFIYVKVLRCVEC